MIVSLVDLFIRAHQTEQSALSLSRALGLDQVAQLLERTTTVTAAAMPAGAELRAVAPELMQEAYLSEDDEEEGGTVPSMSSTMRTQILPERLQATRRALLGSLFDSIASLNRKRDEK